MQSIPFYRAFFPSFIMLLVAFLIAIVFSKTSDVVFFQIEHSSLLDSILWGSALGLGLFVALTLLMFLLRPIYPHIDGITRQLNALFGGYNWLMIILLSLVAGIGEELLFRGLIQRYLAYLLNPWVGIILASFIFGVCHYLNRLYVFLAFSMGAIIGVVYHLSNDLLMVMTLHAVYDFFAFAAIIKYPQMLGLTVER